MSLDKRSYEEKRSFIRMPVDCEVTLEKSASGKRFLGSGKNLSASGVLFHTDELLEPGDQLEMHIEASQVLLSVMDAAIKVIRVEPLGDGLSYAVASTIQAIHDQ